jgi:thiamine biosynthesis lipoprotein
MDGKNAFSLSGVSKIRSLTCLLCLVLLFKILSGCAKKEKTYRESRIAMDTVTTITVLSPSREKAEEAIEAGFAEVKRLEHLLNYYSDESEISAINRSSGKSPARVSRDTFDVIKKSVRIAEETGGAFNPAIGPVMKLWKFARQEPGRSLPSGKMISDTLKLVDYRKIRMSESDSEILLEEAGMEIDLGGIAKGYAADRAIAAIRSQGARAALVSIAGDIKGFGSREEGGPWRVGIQNPRSSTGEEEETDIVSTIDLSNMSVSTSGDYQRFFIKDGTRYHHIIDSRTGYPTESRLISVSVMAPEGYIADGFSTGVFVLGAEKGIDLLESNGLEGILIDIDRRIYTTERLRGKISILKQGYRFAD